MLFVVLLALALALIAVLVRRVTRRRRTLRVLPALDLVADYSSGVLACPRCRGTSFQSPPSGSTDFFALALGPFVFGSLSAAAPRVVECVTCGDCYQRGDYTRRASAVGAGSAPQ